MGPDVRDFAKLTASTRSCPERTVRSRKRPVEAIAERVAARLAGHAREPVRLYDTRAVARMLAVSEDWVRDHAAELGAIRVGDSPRGPLRFDSNKLAAAIDRRRVGRPEPARRPRRPGPRPSGGVELLPLPTEGA
jgi:hypothetical protein